MKTIILLTIYFIGVIGNGILLLLDNADDSVMEHVKGPLSEAEAFGDPRLNLLVKIVIFVIIFGVCLLWPAALLKGIYDMITKGREKS